MVSSSNNPNRFSEEPSGETLENFRLDAEDTLKKLLRKTVLYSILAVVFSILLFLIFFKPIKLHREEE